MAHRAPRTKGRQVARRSHFTHHAGLRLSGLLLLGLVAALGASLITNWTPPGPRSTSVWRKPR